MQWNTQEKIVRPAELYTNMPTKFVRKTFKKIILERPNFQLRELKVIRDNKYDFNRGQLTTQSLLRNVERIMHSLDNIKATVAFFLDIEQAYDEKNGVFWVVTPCDSCKNRRFGGTWRLLHQDDKNR
jgi:hypothetical protein